MSYVCSKCNLLIVSDDQIIKKNEQPLCPDCQSQFKGAIELPMDFEKIEEEKSGLVGNLRHITSFVKLGATGGLLICIICAVGIYLFDSLSKLTMIFGFLFVIGVYLIFKGIKERNFWGERTEALHKEYMTINEFKSDDK